jgi:hypothetical protein
MPRSRAGRRPTLVNPKLHDESTDFVCSRVSTGEAPRVPFNSRWGEEARARRPRDSRDRSPSANRLAVIPNVRSVR